jgi:hypothetical protein
MLRCKVKAGDYDSDIVFEESSGKNRPTHKGTGSGMRSQAFCRHFSMVAHRRSPALRHSLAKK